MLKKSKVLSVLIAASMAFVFAASSFSAVDAKSPRADRVLASDMLRKVDSQYESSYNAMSSITESEKYADDGGLYEFLDLIDSTYAMNSLMLQAMAQIESPEVDLEESLNGDSSTDIDTLLSTLFEGDWDTKVTLTNDDSRFRGSLIGEDPDDNVFVHMLLERRFSRMSCDFGTEKDKCNVIGTDVYVSPNYVYAQLITFVERDAIDSKNYYSVTRLMYNSKTMRMSTVMASEDMLPSLRVKCAYRSWEDYRFKDGHYFVFDGKKITIHDTGETYTYSK